MTFTSFSFQKRKGKCNKKVKNWHFQISKVKRVYIKKKSNGICTVRGETTYWCDVEIYKRLTKVGKTIDNCILEGIEKKNALNPKKKEYVDKFLTKDYGNQLGEFLRSSFMN